MAIELHKANEDFSDELRRNPVKNKKEETLFYVWFLRGWSKSDEHNLAWTDSMTRRDEENYNFAAFCYAGIFCIWFFAFFDLIRACLSGGYMSVLGMANLHIIYYVLASAFWLGSGLYLDRQKKILKWGGR